MKPFVKLDERYWVCSLFDSREAHLHVVKTFLKQPNELPDFLMIKNPIWSTWAKFKSEINESKVTELARAINSYEFPNSQLEIDDRWETCYGSLEFDTTRFPNMTHLSETLSELGFRTTIWVHPFINKDCNPWYSYALEHGFLVKSNEGSVDAAWWNGPTSAIDITNPEARNWWIQRLKSVMDENLIFSLKVDAGETGYLPQIPIFNISESLTPNIYSNIYASQVAMEFGRAVEVRVGFLTQERGIFVRMHDRDTHWGINNGLKSVVTTMLTMNLAGYTFVLPDMVGGNGDLSELSKELFIRWLEAVTFMPIIQFSYLPWDLDDEVVNISKKFVMLHSNYSTTIYSAMNTTVTDGVPTNPPIWWLDPTDETAQQINDEYLLGTTILVAPVLQEGANSRDIYLPSGKWKDEVVSGAVYEGPVWLRNYSAPLDTLPYFTLIS